MSETRLAVISEEQVERLEHITNWLARAMREEPLLRSIVTAYEKGITEEQRALAIHCIEAHAGFAPKHELEPLRQLLAAFNQEDTDD